MQARNPHIIEAFHLVSKCLCRKCRFLRNRNVTGSARRNNDGSDAVFFREFSADCYFCVLKICVAASFRVLSSEKCLCLPALRLIHAGDQERLLSAFFHRFHDSGDLLRRFPRSVDHLRRSLTQLPVGIQLREPQVIVSCCRKRLFLQFQDSVIHRQLACRHLFQHFAYVFHV